jgi:subfamily B ATP-binding cassette protein MsbA
MGGNIVASTIKTQNEQLQAWKLANPGKKAPKPVMPPGGLSPGALIAFFFLLNAVVQSASDIGSIANTRAQMLAAARRIFDEVLDVESEVKERPDATVLPEITGNIRFENVSFRYCADCPDVLRNVSFEIRPGEVVALVGRSGAGKSTLVDLIPRFYDPTEGRILIDGIDLRDVQLESLRQQIGIVPQETWLFAGTLRDNIAYGKRDATDDAIKHAAYSANASFIEGMEKKIDTVVGERGISLSGGERQRIAIARAILMNPRLLILDEATSSLDASSEALVQEALDELMKRRTTIVIAHRLSTIINANRILAMENGRIVEMGSHNELMAAGGYYARLYETQLRGFE